MKTRTLVKWALPVAGLAGAVALWLGRSPEPTSASAGAAAARAPQRLGHAPEPAQASGPCAFTPGERLGFSLRSTTAARLDLSAFGRAGNAPIPQTTLETRASLDLEVLHAGEPAGAVLLGRLHQIDPETVARVGPLALPFLVRVRSDCSLAGFARERSAQLVEARGQQAVLHELWWQVPEQERAEASASNGTGAYQAVVARGEDAKGAFAQRRIVRYVRGWATPHDGLSIADSLLTIRYGSRPWFDAMEGVEELSGAGTGTSRTRLTVTAQAPADEALAEAPRDPGRYVWEDLLPRRLAAQASQGYTFTTEDRRRHTEQEQVTYPQAMNALAATILTTPNLDSQWREMAAWLEANPKEIPTAAGTFLHPECPSKLQMVGFMALGKARVPEARDVLLEIRANRSVGTWNRIRSTFALVGRQDVGIELARALRSDARALTGSGPEARYARHALLGLGMMAGLRAGRDAEVSQEAVQAVDEALSAAATADKLSPVFRSIGNIGDPAMQPLVERWRRHEDVEVRALVPHAMRRWPWEAAERFTLEWLREETAPDVKQAMYEVVLGQLVDSRAQASDALVQQALSDLKAGPRLLTRQSLVAILGPAAETRPELQAELAAQAVGELGTRSGLYDALSQYVDAATMHRTLEASGWLAQRDSDRFPRAAPAEADGGGDEVTP